MHRGLTRPIMAIQNHHFQDSIQNLNQDDHGDHLGNQTPRHLCLCHLFDRLYQRCHNQLIVVIVMMMINNDNDDDQ